MELLVASLLNWISTNTPFYTDDIPPPAIVELSAESLTREYYQDNLDQIPESGVDDRIRALYSWEDGQYGTIFILNHTLVDVSLSQETGLNNPWFQEMLLHELIHHVQHHTGAYSTFDCRNEGERDAYLYGGVFLKQQSVADPLPNRNILAHLYSRC